MASTPTAILSREERERLIVDVKMHHEWYTKKAADSILRLSAHAAALEGKVEELSCVNGELNTERMRLEAELATVRENLGVVERDRDRQTAAHHKALNERDAAPADRTRLAGQVERVQALIRDHTRLVKTDVEIGVGLILSALTGGDDGEG